MSRGDGGYAFPGFGEPAPEPREHGMTLRDWFAGQALAALASRAPTPSFYPEQQGALDQVGAMAGTAYRIADAMLAEREK